MKLETGKRYVLRDGRVTEPLFANKYITKYKYSGFVDGDPLSWMEDGSWRSPLDTCRADIVAVFDEAAPEPVHVNEALILHVMEIARIALRLPRVAVKIADELDLSDESMHEIISFLESKLK